MQPDILDLLAKDKATAEQKRERNRRDFPEVAALMDLLAPFAPRVVWWRTADGRVLGKPPTDELERLAA